MSSLNQATFEGRPALIKLLTVGIRVSHWDSEPLKYWKHSLEVIECKLLNPQQCTAPTQVRIKKIARRLRLSLETLYQLQGLD